MTIQFFVNELVKIGDSKDVPEIKKAKRKPKFFSSVTIYFKVFSKQKLFPIISLESLTEKASQFVEAAKAISNSIPIVENSKE